MQKEYIFFNGKRVARRDLSDGSVKYYFSDHLGSSSVITNATGTMPPLEESDYYPYGGELSLTNNDPNAYKFTGKERDAESGLDEFGARYYTSSLGRFMIPDWAASPTTVPYAHFGNPQSLNLYGYVVNNPLSLRDDDGHEILYDDGLKNAQVVKDSVQAILDDPNTSANLSGYVGKDNPNLLIQSGDLSKLDSSTHTPDGTPGASITQGSTDVSGLQTTTYSDGESTISGSATMTIDNRTSKGDTPGVMVHEAVHAGEGRKNPSKFAKDAAAEKKAFPDNHNARPQEQRANAAEKAFSKEIKKAVKDMEKERKKKESKHNDDPKQI